MNILTFDIEEWYLEKVLRGAREHKYRQFDTTLNQVLDLLDALKIQATFFCLGKMAGEYPQVVKLISSKGHDIGCHSGEHKWLTKMTPAELKEDTLWAKKSLEDTIGKTVDSYRAPAFSIGKENSWAMEVLYECGIRTDASVFPAPRDFGGWSEFKENKPCKVKINGAEIKEFPVSVMSLLGKQLAYSGGGYFRVLPYSLIRHQMKKSNYNISYFHLADLIGEQKKLFSKQEYEDYFKQKGTLINRYKRYIKSNVNSSDGYLKMKKLLAEFPFVSVKQAQQMIDWNKVNRVMLGQNISGGG